MSEVLIQQALWRLNPTRIGIGGGEALASDTFLKKLRHGMLNAGCYPDEIWWVTNGKGLWRHGEKLAEQLADLPANTLWLAISTDQYHGQKAVNRYHHAYDLFEAGYNLQCEVRVVSHGPGVWDNKPGRPHELVSMGRTTTYQGIEIKIEADEDLMYVDINGYVWGSCDLSYKFMDNPDNRKGVLCYGHLWDDTLEYINQGPERFKQVLSQHNDTSIYVTEHGTDVDHIKIKELEEVQ